MNIRSLLPLCIGVLMFSAANGGLVVREDRPPATSTAVADKPSQEASKDALGKEKTTLNRLVTELQRSARSFVYLRSVGFTESDQEFEQIIAKNNWMFRPVRIVRRDEQGNRQIPGWPGIALTTEYKNLQR
jgi:hypothetical protein